MDRRDEQPAYGSDEVASLLKGLRLAVIALVSAAATAGLVIGLSGGLERQAPTQPLTLISSR